MSIITKHYKLLEVTANRQPGQEDTYTLTAVEGESQEGLFETEEEAFDHAGSHNRWNNCDFIIIPVYRKAM